MTALLITAGTLAAVGSVIWLLEERARVRRRFARRRAAHARRIAGKDGR